MGVSSATLIKRAIVLCLIISVSLVLLPNSFISKGSANSFGVVMETETDKNLRVEVSRDHFERRLTSLQQGCSSQNQRKETPKTLLCSRRLDIIYCPIYNAASSEMKFALLKSEDIAIKQVFDFSFKHRIDVHAKKLNLPAKVRDNPSKLKKTHALWNVFLVRNPWMRLLSLYLEDTHQFTSACKEFQHKETEQLGFEGFLRCSVQRTNRTSHINTLDVRLSSTTHTCGVCNIPYDVILHYETLMEDLRSLAYLKPSAQKLLDYVNASPIREHEIPDEDYREYINGLQRQTIDDVQEIHRDEFELFGYDKL